MKVLVTSSERGAVELVERPDPVAATGQVVVDVLAATLNPADVTSADGVFRDLGMVDHDRPVGVGWDVVGRVREIGSDVTAYALGDVVAGLVSAIDVPIGGVAERIALDAADLARVPENLEPVPAATVILNGLTADQALDLLGEPAGRTLLVTGAAGAVGGYALELGASRGWQVTGLAREMDREFVTRAGAKLVTELDGTAYDAVFDPAVLQLNPELSRALFASVRPGGTLVGVMSAVPPDVPGATGVAVAVHPDAERLGRLLDDAAAGRLTTRVAGTVALSGADVAIERVRHGGHRGRWVVVPG